MTLLFIASKFLIEQPTNILTGQGKHCEHFEIKNCKTTTPTTTNGIARIIANVVQKMCSKFVYIQKQSKYESQ